MYSSDRPDFPTRRLARTAAWAAMCGVCLLAAASCRRTSTVNKVTNKKEECGTILTSSIDMAQPLSLGLTTTIEGVVNRLNDSRKSCPDMQKTPAALDADARKRLAAVFSKEDLAAMEADAYDEQDARHIRNCLVFVRIANLAAESSLWNQDKVVDKELGKVVDLFEYVVRSVELVERAPDAAPRPVFRTMLFGRGTAADRTWLYAALLRQLGFSAVVISPRQPSAATKSHFLVGVLLNGTIHLFDPHLGLPVPAPDDDPSTPMIRKPATLAQFIADPGIAASLSVKATNTYKYPLTSGDLKNPRVQLIGHRSLWSPRMKRLDKKGVARNSTKGEAYQEDQRARLFDELGGKQGLIARTVEFGKGLVQRDDVSIWPYPQQLITAFANMTPTQRSQLANLERPFEVPRDVIVDKESGRVVIDPKTGRAALGPQTRLQLKARIRQMMGEYDKAVTSYLSVRSQATTTLDRHRADLPLPEQQMLNRAEHDAEFWIGLCKLELGDVATTMGILTRPRIRTSAKWSVHSAYLQALCHAKQNQFASARTELSGLMSRKPPQEHGYAVLWQRWNALGKTPAKKPKE